MKNKINIYLIEYAINAILRQKYKSFFVTTSIFFITSSIKHELDATVDALPQIIVQKIKAGRHYDIDTDVVDNILGIAGVSDAVARVWGYYYFENAGVNFSVVGVDQFENQYKNSFERIVNRFDFDMLDVNSSMVVGVGVKRVMNDNYYKEYFNFIKPDGTLNGDTSLESNDMIIMPKDIVREIFDIQEDMATDIVVKVANPEDF